MILTPLISSLEKSFKKMACTKTSLEQSAYMKNRFSFNGLKKPLRATLQKEVFAKFPISTEEELSTAVKELWNKEEREYQYAACDLAESNLKLCSAEMISTLEMMIRTKSWWDTVDRISSNLLGPLLKANPSLKTKMNLWILDPHLWIRRSALLFQLKFKESTENKRLFEYCTLTMHEKEFFIQKAIGWVLREYSKTSPHEVKEFITRYREKLSNLSIREGSKYLP